MDCSNPGVASGFIWRNFCYCCGVVVWLPLGGHASYPEAACVLEENKTQVTHCACTSRHAWRKAPVRCVSAPSLRHRKTWLAAALRGSCICSTSSLSHKKKPAHRSCKQKHVQ
ncbi:unnamed protein product [Effrenium voratum]|nr:unnamed protein product [Effrenium voratum]